MVAVKAIEIAKTSHVIYFLLAAYVETLSIYESLGSNLPAQVRKLPLRGWDDVQVRLCVLRGLVENSTKCARDMRRVAKEAAEVFAVAAQAAAQIRGIALPVAGGVTAQ